MKITLKILLISALIVSNACLFSASGSNLNKSYSVIQNDSAAVSVEKIDSTFFNADGTYKTESFTLNYDFAVSNFNTSLVEQVISGRLEVSFLRNKNGAFVLFRDFIHGKPEKDYIIFAYNYK